RVPHRLPLFLRVEVLVDPADRLVLGPEWLNLRMVDLGQHRQQCRLAGEEPPLRAEAVEKYRQVHRELVEDTEQVHPVGVARLSERGAGQPGVELEAL